MLQLQLDYKNLMSIDDRFPIQDMQNCKQITTCNSKLNKLVTLLLTRTKPRLHITKKI